MRFGIKVGLVNLVSLLNYRADLYIVALLATTADLGMYTVAIAAAESLLVPTQVAALVTSPHIGSLDKNAAARLAARCIRVNLLIALAVCGLLFIVATPLVHLLYGAAFLPVVPALRILLLGVLALSLGSPMATYFTLKMGRPEVPLRLAGTSAVICIAVAIVLLPQFGIVGAAIGSSTAYIIGQAAAFWYFTRTTGLDFASMIVPDPRGHRGIPWIPDAHSAGRAPPAPADHFHPVTPLGPSAQSAGPSSTHASRGGPRTIGRMVGRLRLPDRAHRATIIGLAFVSVLGVIACVASVMLSGTKTGAALALIATLGPIIIYTAIVAPIIFPFGLYAMLTPLDTLLALPGFGTMTKILGVITGAALLFYMIRTKRGVQPPPVAVIWLVFYLWVTSTLWWAIDTDSSFKVLGISWSLLLLFIVTSMFRLNASMLRGAINAVLIGGVISALYGLYFFHSGGNLTQTGGRLWIQTDDASINPDHFANSFILPATLALVAALWATRWRARLLYSAGLFLMLLCMALTGARGGMLGFGAAALFLLFRDRHRAALAMLLGGGAIVGLAARGQFLIARFSTAVSTGGAGRVDIWRAGFAAFKQYWLFGAGYGNFPLAYNRFYLNVFQSVDPHFSRASHNMVLNAAVETGIIGLVLLLTAWVQTFRMLSPIQESDYRYPLRLALQGSIVGLFVAGMFVDMMISKYVWLAFTIAVMTYNAGPVYISALAARRISTEAAVVSSA